VVDYFASGQAEKDWNETMTKLGEDILEELKWYFYYPFVGKSNRVSRIEIPESFRKGLPRGADSKTRDSITGGSTPANPDPDKDPNRKIPDSFSDKEGHIANKTGRKIQEIRHAIEQVKQKSAL
jgi:hypothetical protein